MLILGEVILRRFLILKCKAYFCKNCVSLFFFNIFYYIFDCNCYIFIRQLFTSNWKFKASPEVDFGLEKMSWRLVNNHFFFYFMFVKLYFILFLLISLSNLDICLFFLNSKDFLYEFWWKLITFASTKAYCLIKIISSIAQLIFTQVHSFYCFHSDPPAYLL